jgi:hypothetical protein
MEFVNLGVPTVLLNIKQEVTGVFASYAVASTCWRKIVAGTVRLLVPQAVSLPYCGCVQSRRTTTVDIPGESAELLPLAPMGRQGISQRAGIVAPA